MTYDVAALTISRWGEGAEERTGHTQVKADTAVLVVCEGWRSALGQDLSRSGERWLDEGLFQRPELDPAARMLHAFDATRRALDHALEELDRDTREDLGWCGFEAIAALITPSGGCIGWAGASSACLVRDGAVVLKTEPHTWIREQVRSGALTREQAAVHPLRNVLTNAVYSAKPPEVVVLPQLRRGDLVLLGSQSVMELLDRAGAPLTLPDPVPSCEALVRQVVERAALTPRAESRPEPARQPPDRAPSWLDRIFRRPGPRTPAPVPVPRADPRGEWTAAALVMR